MNRRDLLKGIFGLIGLLPFSYFNKIKEHHRIQGDTLYIANNGSIAKTGYDTGSLHTVICGVDLGTGSDETFYEICDLENSKALPLKDYSEFEGILSIEEYAKRMGIFLPFGTQKISDLTWERYRQRHVEYIEYIEQNTSDLYFLKGEKSNHWRICCNRIKR